MLSKESVVNIWQFFLYSISWLLLDINSYNFNDLDSCLKSRSILILLTRSVFLLGRFFPDHLKYIFSHSLENLVVICTLSSWSFYLTCLIESGSCWYSRKRCRPVVYYAFTFKFLPVFVCIILTLQSVLSFAYNNVSSWSKLILCKRKLETWRALLRSWNSR